MSEITPELVSRLYDGHAAALELYAAQWASAPADVVQEAFLQLFRQNRVPENPVPWLYRVVRNGALSAARSESRRRRRETAKAPARTEWFEPAEESGLDAATAAEALRSIGDAEREVVIARIWGGLTFEEIGEVAGISTSTAHRRYEAAIRELRERLGVTWLTTKCSLLKT